MPYQLCGGATWVTTAGSSGLRICCWNDAASAYSSMALSRASRFAASGPPTRANCSLAAARKPNRRMIFIRATGSDFAVDIAIFSRSICCGVPSGLTWLDSSALALRFCCSLTTTVSEAASRRGAGAGTAGAAAGTCGSSASGPLCEAARAGSGASTVRATVTAASSSARPADSADSASSPYSSAADRSGSAATSSSASSASVSASAAAVSASASASASSSLPRRSASSSESVPAAESSDEAALSDEVVLTDDDSVDADEASLVDDPLADSEEDSDDDAPSVAACAAGMASAEPTPRKTASAPTLPMNLAYPSAGRGCCWAAGSVDRRIPPPGVC